jgi:hypothetical protein
MSFGFCEPTKVELNALHALADQGQLSFLDSAGALADSFDEILAEGGSEKALASVNELALELYRQARHALKHAA